MSQVESTIADPGPQGSRVGLEEWASRLRGQPMRNTLALLSLCSCIFYKAEKGKNPKVNDFWDAILYCSTCAAAGHGDISAHTPAGKAIGSLLFTVGPALTSKVLDGHKSGESQELQRQTLTTLQQILAELQAQGHVAKRP